MADGGEREKEGKSHDCGGSGAIYRREESWARGAASGEGRTSMGRLGGEVAERAGGKLHGGAAGQLGSASGTRVSVGRCQGEGQVVLEGYPGSIWPRLRRGLGPPAAYGGRRAKQSTGRREMEVRAFL